MTPAELMALARRLSYGSQDPATGELLSSGLPSMASIEDVEEAARYLRACAEAEPVACAWMKDGRWSALSRANQDRRRGSRSPITTNTGAARATARPPFTPTRSRRARSRHCGASGAPDPQRIHEIDDGGCQGTLVYVIGENDYQPDKYWYVKVGYGSCSVCDTLESIRDYSDSAPTAEQIRRYMTLALHIVQGLREMGRTDA